MPLELNNEWLYDYTLAIESVTGELDDYAVTVEENQTVSSYDSIGNFNAYKIDSWQQDSTLIMSEWFTQNDTGLFSVAYSTSLNLPRSELHFNVGNHSFNSIAEFYMMLINSVSRDTTIFDTTRMILKYPLSVGSSWIWFNDSWLAIRTVEGTETIETTAGIFECQRIKIDYDLTDEIVYNEWWSQDIGLIKRDLSIYNMIHTDENNDSLGLFNTYVTWDLKETNLLGNIEDSPLAFSYKLYPAYPNPFNPTTTISYQLPHSVFVNLSIYNIAGQLVETVVNKHQNRGFYMIEWDAENVSSGLYIYRIEAGEYTETKKCLILK
ncbi:MAG: T9SS type A sorting domain-containing protein [Candidatus Marinimicrobia bacterium]|nr:T9SS type A sorting domain-containing protein [Candidatus Neomarinimicrobiota bacterium]MBL7047271.1 T9SS type A sorting domain-containing protein [Candidatus Neomarinimicrobiota bacterium]